ncbi:glycine betaine/proline transport system substrate-binding protein [Streptohalobacillus salinus]|uniref:Glycine betaine/proline transport system substrate-binding protein n=1 Tax=Streptohalobacillus salinus TaxID=621096 RepID=A0A2V3WGT7_9BACI|nr:glycine betaine ABC transporter substrate-binding protein [Streptohalobacillus salinus]PXW91455.1 glycine betaine/proline transport system substrate-binding protein [Streptohalobacillus salinus]
MFKKSWKHIGLMLVLALTLVLAACGDDSADTDGDSDEDTGNLGETEIELAYVEWDSEIASTNVLALVLEEAGYDVDVTGLDNAIMWEAVANGDADGMVAAWLPGTHGDLYEANKDSLVELGVNLEGAKIGLVVPAYMEDVNTIGDLADHTEAFDGKITGIEPGAGVVQAAEQALEDYDLADWEVQTSSSGAMTTTLDQAYSNEEPIVVTGWTPHWKFAAYDLKYLEDPEGTFGGAETIETMVREGFEEDSPAAYQIMDNFYWEADDMQSVMLEMSEGADPEEAAANWIENNRDAVDEWLEGVE